MLNVAKDNGATESIEEIDNLLQILEGGSCAMKIGGERDILSVKLKALQHNFNEEKSKSDKGFKTIKLIKKDLKLAKAARKSADNSTFLQSDSF